MLQAFLVDVKLLRLWRNLQNSIRPLLTLLTSWGCGFFPTKQLHWKKKIQHNVHQNIVELRNEITAFRDIVKWNECTSTPVHKIVLDTSYQNCCTLDLCPRPHSRIDKYWELKYRTMWLWTILFERYIKDNV